MRPFVAQRQCLQPLAGLALDSLNGLLSFRYYSSGDTPDRSSTGPQDLGSRATPQEGFSQKAETTFRPRNPAGQQTKESRVPLQAQKSDRMMGGNARYDPQRSSRVRLQADKLEKMMGMGAQGPRGPPATSPGSRSQSDRRPVRNAPVNTSSVRVKVDAEGRPFNLEELRRPTQRIENDFPRPWQPRFERQPYREQGAPFQRRAPSQAGSTDPSNLDPEDLQEDDLRGQGTRRAREKALRSKNKKDDTGTMDVFQGDLRDRRSFRPSQRRSRSDDTDDRSSRPRGNRPPFGFNEIATPAEKELQRELGQFSLGPEEPLGLIDRVTKQRITSTAKLPITQYQAQNEIERVSDMDGDPTVNINWLSPRRISCGSVPTPSVDDVAEQYRAEWTAMTGLTSDEDWNEFKKAELADVMGEVERMAQNMGLLQGQREEQQLTQYLDRVEVDNPSYMHVALTIHQLNRNPFWEFQQKEKYLDRLIKTVNDPRHASAAESQLG